MAKRLSPDFTLLATTVLLMGFGMVMVWSASSTLAQDSHGSANYFLFKQMLWGVIGIGCMVAALRVDYRALRRPPVVYTLLTVSTLLLIAVLFLPAVNGSHRWIRLGPLSFQPAELAKLSIVVYLAFYIERRAERITELTLLRAGAAAAVLVRLRGADRARSRLGLLPGAGRGRDALRRRRAPALLRARSRCSALGGLAVAILAVPWRFRRLLVFLDPWTDPQGAGYQVIQSLIAVGTGGLSGVGLGEGRQKLFYLPYPYSDFIFAVIGEELGLLGTLAVVAAFMVLLWRGLRVAWKAPDDFGRFLAIGLTLSIVLQALINISVTVGLLPTKGIPLPFISAGGSSLVFALVAIGLVANVSQYAD